MVSGELQREAEGSRELLEENKWFSCLVEMSEPDRADPWQICQTANDAVAPCADALGSGPCPGLSLPPSPPLFLQWLEMKLKALSMTEKCFITELRTPQSPPFFGCRLCLQAESLVWRIHHPVSYPLEYGFISSRLTN